VQYRQRRTGRDGHDFDLLKFRSMRIEPVEAPAMEERAHPAQSSTMLEVIGPGGVEGADRRTPIGRFIRRSSLDELPQLWNVFKGDMSLVGPRPERPHFVEQLDRAIPFYRHRASVKPGLTGWAQVNFPYGASVEDAREKLSYDLFYVKHRTILLDTVILLSTIRVVLFREGAR
jgi:lipopolysaccharide/colanic/teichoic acid biosynthesis glycosyltransferase